MFDGHTLHFLLIKRNVNRTCSHIRSFYRVYTHRASILCIPVYTHILSKSNQIETEGVLKYSCDNCFDVHLFYTFFVDITFSYAHAPMTSLHVCFFVNNIVIHCQEKQIEGKTLRGKK